MEYVKIVADNDNKFWLIMRNNDYSCKMLLTAGQIMSIAQDIENVVDGTKDSVELKF